MTTTSVIPDREMAVRLNWLRAGVLGANDGIVSVACIVVGVAAATTGVGATHAIVIAGIAGLLAGSLSMSTGEYVSVSAQRDSEKAEHARNGTDGHLVSPWHAAFASAAAFLVGGVLPLLTIWLTSESLRIWATVASVVAALVLTGVISATLGRSSRSKAVVRNVVGGLFAMAVTYGVGTLLGTTVL